VTGTLTHGESVTRATVDVVKERELIYPRPAEKSLAVTRESVDGACPECGAMQLQRYPVLAAGGWFDVVKCQACLRSVSRERGPLHGPIALYSSLLPEARG
jgi:hypothetical protein